MAGHLEPIEEVANAVDDVKLDEVGDTVEQAAKELVPVETGALRDSIRHQVGTDAQGPYVDVIAGSEEVDYAALVEFGSGHGPPQPFLSTAAEAERARIQEELRDEIVRAQREALSKLPRVIVID